MSRPRIGLSLAMAAAVLPFASSCKTRSGTSELHDFWLNLLDTKYQAVQEVSDKNEYITRWSQLPLGGAVMPTPWSGYKVFAEGVDPGLNESWAAAALLYAEPRAVKTKNAAGQTMEVPASAIRSQLVDFVRKHSTADEGVETRSLGGLCRTESDSFRRGIETRTLTASSAEDLKHDSCYAVDAAAFHLALANFVGLRQEGFIIDPKVDLSFDHKPVISYKSEVLVQSENPEGGSLLQIQTTVITELAPYTYRYAIEVDAAGDIVSGTWSGADKPQLAWMQNRPKFTPNDAELEKLYTASVSLPQRMAMHDFSPIAVEAPRFVVHDDDPLVINTKYRLELKGEVPKGADGLKTFLMSSFRGLGPISIYRNTFADEDAFVTVQVQCHQKTSFAALKEAVRTHSNGRAEISQILRP